MGREFFFSVFLVLSSTGDRGGEREEEEEEEDEDEEDDEEDDDAARREDRDLGVAAADLVAAALDFAGVVDDFDFPRSASKRKEIDGFKKVYGMSARVLLLSTQKYASPVWDSADLS